MNARRLIASFALLGCAHAAIVPGVVFRSKATNTQVEIKFDGATLTVPQHCRLSTCETTSAGLSAASAKIDSVNSALKTATGNNANYISINSANIATLQSAMIAENTALRNTDASLKSTDQALQATDATLKATDVELKAMDVAIKAKMAAEDATLKATDAELKAADVAIHAKMASEDAAIRAALADAVADFPPDTADVVERIDGCAGLADLLGRAVDARAAAAFDAMAAFFGLRLLPRADLADECAPPPPARDA